MFIEEKKTFAIEYNGKVIGSIGIEKYPESELEEFKEKRGREIGYALSKDYWGQGIVAEGVNKIIEYLFNEVKDGKMAHIYITNLIG